ncbi:hypothetical protein MAR_006493 [Mya arenaria]|uniref:Fibronectin type-III domain-containing protein n=1 Tax=Mya arenaria TaxID=6604 RepID=A0ABY7DB65_MYAAR|nr:hypothetical protein MAR_006493 [Mya arenaria]
MVLEECIVKFITFSNQRLQRNSRLWLYHIKILFFSIIRWLFVDGPWCEHCKRRGGTYKLANFYCNICKTLFCIECQDCHELYGLKNCLEGSVLMSQFCSICKTSGKMGIAFRHCTECGYYLCKECSLYHTRNKVLKTHILDRVNKDHSKHVCSGCGETEQRSHAHPPFTYCTHCKCVFCEACFTKNHENEWPSKHINVNTRTCSRIFPCGPCFLRRQINKAVFYCTSCDFELFCEDCAKYHGRQKIALSHELHTDMENIDSEIERLEIAKETRTCDGFFIPGIPTIDGVGVNHVRLSWNQPVILPHNGRYRISTNTPGVKQWSVYDEGIERNENVKVEDLTENRKYRFKVTLVFNENESFHSRESEWVVTKESEVSKLAKQAIEIPSESNLEPAKYIVPMSEVTVNTDSGGDAVCQSVQERTILLIGETGTGKSTMVDGIVNFALGVEWKDPVRFTVGEHLTATQSQASSQTQWINCYHLFPGNSGRVQYQVNIIDTPGFADTRGIERDMEIVHQIGELFQNCNKLGIYSIDAVGFVVKSPDARLSVSQRYVFDSIMSLFGKDMEKNVYAFITFADTSSSHDPPVLASLKASGFSFARHFIFNNSSLFAGNKSETCICEVLKLFWEIGLKSFFDFFGTLERNEGPTLNLTIDVLQERRRISSLLTQLQPYVDNGFSLVETMQTLKRDIAQSKKDTELSMNYETVHYVEYQNHIKLPPGKQSTFCSNCNVTCHKICTVVFDHQKRQCDVMNISGYCTICPGRCVWNSHITSSDVYEMLKREQRCKNQRMYESNMKAVDTTKNLQTLISDTYTQLQRCRTEIERLIAQHDELENSLERMALAPHSKLAKEMIEIMIENEKMLKSHRFLETISRLNTLKSQLGALQNAGSFLKLASRANGDI